MRKEKGNNEKLENIMKQLENGVQQLRSSDKWKEYLIMQSKLPHYSYNNTLLVLWQTKGEATYCMSYGAWEKLGRHVKQGEKGIKIICPVPTKKEYEVDKRDENGKIMFTEEGKPQKEMIQKVVMKFKVGYTFDVSQTEGNPIPEICRVLQGDVEGFQELKEAIISISPVPVKIEPVNGKANGYYSLTEKEIVVDSHLSEKHQIHTLLHEIAHAKLDLSGADQNRTRAEKEVEAESIAFICLNAILGDQADTEELGTYSFGYVGGWSDENLNEMKTALSIIQQTASEIIGNVELAMSQLQVAKECALSKETQKHSQIKLHKAVCM